MDLPFTPHSPADNCAQAAADGDTHAKILLGRALLKEGERQLRSAAMRGSAEAQSAWDDHNRGAHDTIVVPKSLMIEEIVGNEPSRRSEMNRRIWAYVVEHGFLDPQRKDWILCDGRLIAVALGKSEIEAADLHYLIDFQVRAADQPPS